RGAKQPAAATAAAGASEPRPRAAARGRAVPRAPGPAGGPRTRARGGRGAARRRAGPGGRAGLPPGGAPGPRSGGPGAGHPAPAPGVPGDLVIITRVRAHRFFTRKGDNLYCEVPITIPEAALGARIQVPTLEGPAVVTVPAGTQSGQVFRLRGK